MTDTKTILEEEFTSKLIASGYSLWWSGSEFRTLSHNLREAAMSQDAYASGWLANPANAEAARLTKLIPNTTYSVFHFQKMSYHLLRFTLPVFFLRFRRDGIYCSRAGAVKGGPANVRS